MNFWYFIGKTFLPQLTWRKSVSEKVVFLTFDDGPHPEVTPWVLDELEKVGAQGTFFVVGENAKHFPDVLADTLDRGHAVENHTHRHIRGWGKNKKVYLKEIEECAKVLGKKRLFRPPYGQIKLGAITEITGEYEVIMWDIISRDFLGNINLKRAQRRIQKATVPGSIIVFHDSEKAEKNLRILLPTYLEFLKREGYEMKAL